MSCIKNFPVNSNCSLDKPSAKSVRFSKSLGTDKSVKTVKRNSSRNKTLVQTVNDTDRSVKGCSSNVVGLCLENQSINKTFGTCCDTELSSKWNQSDNFKLAVPELCTSLKIANNLLEAAALPKETHSTSSVTSNCHGKTSASMKSKALSQMNVPFEKQVFKDLIALNINAEDLLSGKDHKLKSKRYERVKDHEPELSNFFNPSFTNEFVVKCELMHFEKDENLNFDGFYLTNRSKRWEFAD